MTGDLSSSLVAMSLTDRDRAEARWRRAPVWTPAKLLATLLCSTLGFRTARSLRMNEMVSEPKPPEPVVTAVSKQENEEQVRDAQRKLQIKNRPSAQNPVP